MKFCRQCGQTLPLLENLKEEYCSQCTIARAEQLSTEDTTVKKEENPDIFSTTLSCKDGKIMLTSKEGWLLWSGAKDEQHSLQQILDRSTSILKIRQKRNN